MSNRGDELMRRLKEKDWIKEKMDEPRTVQAMVFLQKDSQAQDHAWRIIDRSENEWRSVEPHHLRAQLFGYIEHRRLAQHQFESLKDLPWFKSLSEDDQKRVIHTAELNARIQSATGNRMEGSDEEEIRDYNPWYQVLGPPRIRRINAGEGK